MASGAATGSSEVLAAFRKYGRLVNSDSDTIEWRLFCSVLRHLEPTYYTDEVLDALFRQVRPSAEKVEPTATVKLEPLIDAIFRPPAGAPAENSSRRSSEASSPGDQAPALRVRKVTGDVVLSLTRKEAKAFPTVLILRAEVAKAASRRIEEVSLVAGVRQLEDAETLEALLPEETVQEVVMAIQQLPPFDPSASPLTQMPALKWMLMSPQPEEQLKAANIFRKMLSVERAPPINLVIENGVVPRLLELCEATDSELQFEAAWALTNVASGTAEQTRVVAVAGVPVFVRLLQSPVADVREQAVWALGNIAGDSCPLRDLVLQCGAMQPLLNVLQEATKISCIRNAVWTLSNLCRGKPQPDLPQVSPALQTLARTLFSADVEVLTDSAWALSHIADGSDEGIAAVVESGVVRRVVELLNQEAQGAAVLTPLLRTVIHIVSGGCDDHRQQVLSAGVLPMLPALIGHAKKSIQVDAWRVISGILSGSHAQIQDVIDAGLVQPLLESLQNGFFEVKKAVAKAIENATSHGSTEQIWHFVEKGCVQRMVEALDCAGNQMGLHGALLDGLGNILRAGDRLKRDAALDANPWVALVTGANGEMIIERWSRNNQQEMSQKAQSLLAQLLAPEVAAP